MADEAADGGEYNGDGGQMQSAGPLKITITADAGGVTQQTFYNGNVATINVPAVGTALCRYTRINTDRDTVDTEHVSTIRSRAS